MLIRRQHIRRVCIARHMRVRRAERGKWLMWGIISTIIEMVLCYQVHQALSILSILVVLQYSQDQLQKIFFLLSLLLAFLYWIRLLRCASQKANHFQALNEMHAERIGHGYRILRWVSQTSNKILNRVLMDHWMHWAYWMNSTAFLSFVLIIYAFTFSAEFVWAKKVRSSIISAETRRRIAITSSRSVERISKRVPTRLLWLEQCRPSGPSIPSGGEITVHLWRGIIHSRRTSCG